MIDEQEPHPALALMARETRVGEGIVDYRLDGIEVALDRNLLRGDCYLLRTETDLRLFYRKGSGITVQRPADPIEGEEELYLKGSVHAAVASINGLCPIHASAVVCDGVVHAFTGPSGAGKSTLAAELARRGLPLFCDDTLVLDLSDPQRPLALPGHKRLKLWPDALALTGARGGDTVLEGMDKVYAQPHAAMQSSVLPLASLTFLEWGEQAVIEPVRGAAKMVRLQDDHYTTDLFLAATRPNLAERFAQLGALARSLDLARFVRPRDSGSFALDAGLAEAHVRSHAPLTPKERDHGPGPMQAD